VRRGLPKRTLSLERALWPAHVGKRIAFAVDAFELEVAGLPAEVANAGLDNAITNFPHRLHPVKGTYS
jgi:hypothetical protein